MSYPPMSSYYGSSSGNQNNHRGYATTGDANNRSNPYQTQSRGLENSHQNQYGSNTYGWSGQNQSATVATSQQGYGNETWQDRSNTPSSYPYQREHYASSEQMTTQAQPYNARDTYSSQNTQGLNNLAYASGLEPTTSVNNSVRTAHPTSQSAYNTTAQMRPPQMRTASPANTNAQYPGNGIQPSHAGAYPNQNDNSSSSAQNHALAVNAAAALAGAARNAYQQSNQHVSSAVANRASNSPMIKQAQVAMLKASQKQPASYNVGPPADHQRKTSSQSQISHSDTTNNVKTTPVSGARHNTHADQSEAPQQSQTRKSAPQSSVQNRSQQPPTQNPQDIANLVNDTTSDPDQAYESVEHQDPMPHYIDPTQVFNPYHREHERKKKEAAEAAARRKAEEQRIAEAKRRDEEEAAKKAPESSATANSKSKITKKGSTAGPNAKNQTSDPLSANTSAALPGEDTMATEMQKMMAKMKEFKTSNPALFQKLWNDMRGGTSAMPSNAASAVQSPPPPQVNQAPLSTPAEQISTPARSRAKKSEQPTPNGPPLNGYRVVVENNPEGLPDLGRFPAERRIRQSYGKSKAEANGEVGVMQEEGQQLQAEATVVDPIQNQSTASSARPADHATSWPEPRRRALAIAAIHYLKSIPENQHVFITAQEICSLLERNPSYLDLCTTLESQGLKFQRTVFARELLKSVPELQTPASKATPATKGMASISSAAHAQSPLPSAASLPADAPQPAAQPLQNLFGAADSGTGMSQSAPIFTGLTAVKAENPRPFTKAPVKPSKAKLNRSEPPPGSKEAAARKRDFAELIDLTDIGDDENYVLPMKQPRLNEAAIPDPLKQIETTIRTGFNTNSSEPLRFNTQAQPLLQPNPLRAPPPPTVPSGPQSRSLPWQPQPSIPNSGRARVLLAQKLDKAEALRKSYYDPKTVARDILIASGRHPSERPLNLHLANLLGKFFDLECDVSTFDWDTVDPGGPPLPRVEYVDVPAAPPRFKLGERVARRKRVKLTDIENTREPERERRKSHSALRSHEPLQAASPGDLILPTPSSKGRGVTVEQELPHHKRTARDAGAGNDSISLTSSNRHISIDSPLNSQRSASHKVNKPASQMDTDATPSGKRRGRPPGSKNKYPSVSSMKQQAKTATVELPAVSDQPPEPIHHVYKCKWAKCHAELHNLETLKRHMAKKHAPPGLEMPKKGYACWWKKCAFLGFADDGEIVPTHTFQTLSELSHHIDESHIRPIALKYGDGPQTHNTDPQSVESARSRYLADPNGRAATPLVSPDGNSDRPPDAMVLTKSYPQGPKSDKEKADITAQNAFMKAHGNKHGDTRKAAEEVVRAMEVRKQKIGPGLDRGGCTLINEERRSTFMQAPGISRIVDADY